MRRLTDHIFWVLAVGFFGGPFGLKASDFVISNARLVVEEVRADSTENELSGRIEKGSQLSVEPSELVKASSAVPVLAMAGPVVFRVEPEAAQLDEVSSRGGSDVKGQGAEQPVGGAVLLSTPESHFAVGRGGTLGLQESFPDWQDGLKPRFIRFGEVW
jgi:hypothetical protein